MSLSLLGFQLVFNDQFCDDVPEVMRLVNPQLEQKEDKAHGVPAEPSGICCLRALSHVSDIWNKMHTKHVFSLSTDNENANIANCFRLASFFFPSVSFFFLMYWLFLLFVDGTFKQSRVWSLENLLYNTDQGHARSQDNTLNVCSQFT